ncbi:MAG: CARDB domain-containing protein [bacterium]
MRKYFYLTKFLVFTTIIVGLVAFNPIRDSEFVHRCYAQEPEQVKAELFREIQELFDQAAAEEIPVFSPTNFARAKEVYQEALRRHERGGRLEDIQMALFQAKTHLRMAFESARMVKSALEDLIALRAEALELAVKESARNSFDTAESAFQRAVLQAEAGNISVAKRIALEIEPGYRETILISLREGALKEARIMQEELREVIHPERYEKSAQNLEKAEAFFEQAHAQGLSAKEFLKLIQKTKKWVFLSPKLMPDLTVELWSVPKSQMKWSHEKWISPYPPTKDQPTTISVLVKNIGPVAVEDSFDTELYVDGKLVKTWTYLPVLEEEDVQHQKNPLMPGETQICEYTKKFSGGKHTFHWKVDTKNEINESDESKNSNELSASEVWLISANLPDLIVEDIFHKDTLLVGQKTTWKIKIKNSGKTDATVPFMTSLKANGVQIGAFWLDILKAGESKTFETKQYSAIITGKYTYKDTITGIVDVGNVIPETNENNNIKAKEFTTSYVDLAVGDNITVTPQQPVVHKPVAISFIVKNNGPGVATKPFKVRVYPGKVVQGKTQPFLLPVPKNKLPLKKGDSINLKHPVQLAYAGDYQVEITADFPGPNDPGFVYKEKDKANNTKTTPKPFHLKETYYVKVDEVVYSPDKTTAYVVLDRSGGNWKGDVWFFIAWQPYALGGRKHMGDKNPSVGVSVPKGSNHSKWIEKPILSQYNLTLTPYAIVGNKKIKSPAPPTKVNLLPPKAKPTKPAPPPPPKPSTKEITVYLQKQKGPLKGGKLPYAGSILPVYKGILQTIKNVNTAMGNQWGVRIIKSGYTTDDCDKPKAVIDLAPGKSTSELKGTSLSNGLAIVACIYPVQATVISNQVALKVTYTK